MTKKLKGTGFYDTDTTQNKQEPKPKPKPKPVIHKGSKYGSVRKK